MPLILLPNFLQDKGPLETMPLGLSEEVKKLEALIAESEKSARRYLVRFMNHEKANSLPLYFLNEHTSSLELKDLLKELKKDPAKHIGLISDAGMPAIADPGANLVFLARLEKIPVKVILGPSAVFYALVSSGLPAQSFSFEGYLPREEEPLKAKLKTLESFSLKNQKTIAFIEAPYRNVRLLEKLIATLDEKTTLAIAADLFSPQEEIIVSSIKEWKLKKIDLHKRPAVFLFFAPKIEIF